MRVLCYAYTGGAGMTAQTRIWLSRDGEVLLVTEVGRECLVDSPSCYMWMREAACSVVVQVGGTGTLASAVCSRLETRTPDSWRDAIHSSEIPVE